MVASRWTIVAFVVFAVVSPTTTYKKRSRKVQQEEKLVPAYEEHWSTQLPNDVQITTFLKKGSNKTFEYHSKSSLNINIIITACSSRVHWSLKHRCNTTREDMLVEERTCADVDLLDVYVSRRLYILRLQALDADSYVHIYISTEPNGPEALRSANATQMHIRRLRGNKMAIKWEPSLVDPQFTEYCLIISTSKHYSTLCSAVADRYGVVKPGATYRRPVAASQTVISWENDRDKYDTQPLVVCTGRKTQYKVENVRKEQMYHFDLFAVDHQSNFTYKMASNSTVVRGVIRPLSIKDGKLKLIDLKERDGSAVVKFKVGRKSQNSLDIYVVPCSGSVDIEVVLKNEIIEAKRMIEGFAKMSLPNPMPGSRYYIKMYSTNGEEIRRSTGVQLFVTARSSSNIPLPELPLSPAVKEYTSLRTCDGVTVGWLPPAELNAAHYCLIIKEGSLNTEIVNANQCGLENRLKKSSDFTLKLCKDIKHNNQKVLTQRIGRLKPGRRYTVQITVRKTKGATISYQLLQVHTKSRCDNTLL